MQRVILLVARLAVGKHLAAGVAALHNLLDGKRSEISAAILVLVHILKVANVLPAETADGIENALLAILPVVLADKVSKTLKAADAVIPEQPKQ